MTYMKQNSHKRRRKIIAVSLLALTSIAGYGLLFPSFSAKQSAPLKISATDFPPQTRLAYEVFSNGKSLHKDTAETDKNGNASLFVPTTAKGETDPLSYKIQIGDQKNDKAMTLALSVKPQDKTLNISGTNLPDSAKILLKNTDKTKAISGDWAGLFNETVHPAPENGKNEPVELAFQGVNFSSDIDPAKSGKLDILFGTPTALGITAVQSRYTSAMIRMADELSAVMVKQTEMIGALFDAKMQMQTQRKLQELQARAHKDYHPSEELCRLGTFMRSVAHTESNAEISKHALNRLLLDDYLSTVGSTTQEGEKGAALARIKHFATTYCNPNDNNTGLEFFCKTTSLTRSNNDVNYSQILQTKLTVDVDFSNNTLTNQEEDLIALARNLYLPQAFNTADKDSIFNNLNNHYDSRAFAAKQSVAHNSFVNIVGMKSSGPAGAADPGWRYMKSMMREFGIADAEINTLLGDRPSYYAQMDVLTKKIYQSPNFYTNLYDKPANVSRIGAAIDAISLMNLRDRQESLMRNEILASLLVEVGLNPEVEDIGSRAYQSFTQPQNK